MPPRVRSAHLPGDRLACQREATPAQRPARQIAGIAPHGDAGDQRDTHHDGSAARPRGAADRRTTAPRAHRESSWRSGSKPRMISSSAANCAIQHPNVGGLITDDGHRPRSGSAASSSRRSPHSDRPADRHSARAESIGKRQQSQRCRRHGVLHHQVHRPAGVLLQQERISRVKIANKEVPRLASEQEGREDREPCLILANPPEAPGGDRSTRREVNGRITTHSSIGGDRAMPLQSVGPVSGTPQRLRHDARCRQATHQGDKHPSARRSGTTPPATRLMPTSARRAASPSSRARTPLRCALRRPAATASASSLAADIPLRYCSTRKREQHQSANHQGAMPPASTIRWTNSGMRRSASAAGRRAVQSASHGASGSMNRGPR